VKDVKVEVKAYMWELRQKQVKPYK
jgi:hypothetical protein